MNSTVNDQIEQAYYGLKKEYFEKFGEKPRKQKQGENFEKYMDYLILTITKGVK